MLEAPAGAQAVTHLDTYRDNFQTRGRKAPATDGIAKLVRALALGGLTTEELVEESGLSLDATRRWVRRLRGVGVCFVSGKREVPGTKRQTHEYTLGVDGVNVKIYNDNTRQRHKRQRARALRMNQLMAGPLG